VVMPRFFRVLALLALPCCAGGVFGLQCGPHGGARPGGARPARVVEPGNLDEKLPELAQQGGRLGLQRELVLLLNLPFAWTALMVAYEDLFGAGRPGRA